MCRPRRHTMRLGDEGSGMWYRLKDRYWAVKELRGQRLAAAHLVKIQEVRENIETEGANKEGFLAGIADLVEALKRAGHDPYGRPVTPRDGQGYPTGEPATHFQLWCGRCGRPYVPLGVNRIASISSEDPCEAGWGPADRIGIRDAPAENR